MSNIEKVLSAVAIAALSSTASVAHAEETAKEGRPALAAAGATIFSLSYIASAAYASMGYESVDATESNRAPLFIPWGGPLAMLSKHPTAAETGMYIADSVVQLGGAAMFVAGMIHTVPVSKKGESSILIAPIVSPHAALAFVGGTF